MKLGIVLITLTSPLAAPLLAQQPSPAERVAALKTQMATSEAALKQYQWIRTTVISIMGEEKSRRQERCVYGLEGKLTQVDLTQEVPPQELRGPLRRRIAERKREELTGFMKEAVAQIHQYIPLTCPDAGLQGCGKDDDSTPRLRQECPGDRLRLPTKGRQHVACGGPRQQSSPDRRGEKLFGFWKGALHLGCQPRHLRGRHYLCLQPCSRSSVQESEGNGGEFRIPEVRPLDSSRAVPFDPPQHGATTFADPA